MRRYRAIGGCFGSVVPLMYDKEAERIVIARLINWGLWSKYGGFPKLNYPAWIEIMREYFPADARTMPDDIDAEHIEHVISTLNIVGRRGLGWGEVYQFILKMEYIEHGRPQIAKAEHVRHKFKQPCSDRTYRYHFYKAKRAIHAFANPF